MSYKFSVVNQNIKLRTFKERLDEYKENQHLLKQMKSHNCLVSGIKRADGNYEYILEEGKLVLKNRIGSKSKYGVIFLTSNKFNKSIFATKLTVMDDENYREIVISKKLSKISSLNLNPHFLFVYKSFYCSNNINQNLPKLIKNENYYISVNELINGNLKQFFDQKLNSSFYLNALEQILLSILSFHYFTKGIYHADCHYKNFLYVKIKAGGYFHYKIFGVDYFVKNMGYLWIIWDFGLVREEPYYKQQRLKDYFRIANFFNLTSQLSKSGNYNNLLKISDVILNYEYNFQLLFGSSDKKLFEDVFVKELNLFKSKNQLPRTFKKINNKPYIINDF